MKPDRWIQGANHPNKKGALHRQLGINLERTIPKSLLHDVVNTPIGKHTHGKTVTPLMKQRANFALNAQKRRR